MKDLSLQRYPYNPKDLFHAWNTADEYIADYIRNNNINSKRVLIIEDEFGALGCSVEADKKYFVNDSILSARGIEINREVNFVEDDAVYLSPFDEFPRDIDLILIKIPKINNYLEFLLDKLNRLDLDIPVIAGGMDKYLNQSIYKIFNNYCNKVTLSRGWKKSRLIFGEIGTNVYKKEFYPEYEACGMTLRNYPNTFSQSRLDAGSALLISSFATKKTDAVRILDIGCGNGVLGLSLAQKFNNAELLFNDISYSAIESAKYNAETNGVSDKSSFYHCYAATEVPSNYVDIVICNPPFHDNHKVSIYSTNDMLREVHRILKCDGELHIVSNRHLNYYNTLKRLYGNCTTYGADPRYVICKSVWQCR